MPLMIGSCIISFSLFAIFGLKEKATKAQLLALLLCLLGLIAVCFPEDILPMLQLTSLFLK